METALVENGRIVVRTPHSEDYGIEVMSAKSRFQLRAVRFGGAADRTRELETIWCRDFGDIRAAIAEAGGGVELDMAQKPGAAPVNVVEAPQDRPSDTQVRKTKLTERNL